MDKEDKNQPKMPLRNKGHEVDVVRMPGQKTPVLGRRYTSEDDSIDVRIQSTMQWDSSQPSPRQQQNQAEPLKQELDQRIRTVLTYDVPKSVSDELNAMQGTQANEGRKTENTNNKEAITVKIGFDP